MEFGSFVEFHTREGRNQVEAFKESFDHVNMAELLGLDTIWLSENHFNPTRSVLSAPLITAAAISGRTERIKIGTAVQILPLANPLRIAEEVATLDHVSGGRFEFGIGRSGLPGAYEGYNISYGESRERFFESLEIIKKALTNDYFSHDGKFHSYDNVCLTPKPLQNPYPPIRVAATTSETFPILGEMGMPIFVGLRGSSLADVKKQVRTYTDTMNRVGKNTPNVHLRVPIHVAKSTEEAMQNSKQSFMRQFRRLGSQLGSTVNAETADSSDERSNKSHQLSEIKWEDIQGKKVVVGDPETVIIQLQNMKKSLNLRGFALEFNAGEVISSTKVKESLILFCKEVMTNI